MIRRGWEGLPPRGVSALGHGICPIGLWTKPTASCVPSLSTCWSCSRPNLPLCRWSGLAPAAPPWAYACIMAALQPLLVARRMGSLVEWGLWLSGEFQFLPCSPKAPRGVCCMPCVDWLQCSSLLGLAYPGASFCCPCVPRFLLSPGTGAASFWPCRSSPIPSTCRSPRCSWGTSMAPSAQPAIQPLGPVAVTSPFAPYWLHCWALVVRGWTCMPVCCLHLAMDISTSHVLRQLGRLPHRPRPRQSRCHALGALCRGAPYRAVWGSLPRAGLPPPCGAHCHSVAASSSQAPRSASPALSRAPLFP